MNPYIEKCPICKTHYYKQRSIKCDKCSTNICLKCTLFAGKHGKFCKNCFEKFPTNKKEDIKKAVKRIKFWANYGYYFFLAFLVGTIFSFSLYFLNNLFLYFGVLFGLASAIYGYYLLKYITKS